jgi:hypothetical protein
MQQGRANGIALIRYETGVTPERNELRRLSRAHEGRAVAARADHDQVIDRHEPVPAVRGSDGSEGATLGFRGAGSAPAAGVDEDEASGPARLGSLEDRACREASCLDPADGQDGRADQAMPVVQVERQRDVLTASAEQVSGELRSRGRPVDSAKEVRSSYRSPNHQQTSH